MGVAIIVCIIIGAGLLGGTANYFMNRTEQGWAAYEFLKSSLLGLTAAATVPLFLKTVSSNLLQDCLSGDILSHFVFFGFCAIAAIFSSKFLQSLADKVLQEVNEVKQKQEAMAETQDTLVLQNSDPLELPAEASSEAPADIDAGEFESFRGGEKTAVAPPAMSDDQKIMKALRPGPGKPAFRTMSGICKDTGMEEKLVSAKITEMEAMGLVKKTKRSSDGAWLWSLK
jgi:hypothetical protein